MCDSDDMATPADAPVVVADIAVVTVAVTGAADTEAGEAAVMAMGVAIADISGCTSECATMGAVVAVMEEEGGQLENEFVKESFQLLPLFIRWLRIQQRWWMQLLREIDGQIDWKQSSI